MEAMSSGLPVVVSNEGGPKTLIREENPGGYVIDINDKQAWLDTMKTLTQDRELRDKLGENGTVVFFFVFAAIALGFGIWLLVR